VLIDAPVRARAPTTFARAITQCRAPAGGDHAAHAQRCPDRPLHDQRESDDAAQPVRVAMQIRRQQLAGFDLQRPLVDARRLDVRLPEQRDARIGGKSCGDPCDDRIVDRAEIGRDGDDRVAVFGRSRDDQLVACHCGSAAWHRQLRCAE
jgi:hypothetical protein